MSVLLLRVRAFSCSHNSCKMAISSNFGGLFSNDYLIYIFLLFTCSSAFLTLVSAFMISFEVRLLNSSFGHRYPFDWLEACLAIMVNKAVDFNCFC